MSLCSRAVAITPSAPQTCLPEVSRIGTVENPSLIRTMLPVETAISLDNACLDLPANDLLFTLSYENVGGESSPMNKNTIHCRECFESYAVTRLYICAALPKLSEI